MKVISWNMNKRKNGTWDYLLSSLSPDIALLQESSIFPENLNKNQISEITVKKNLRNSIFCPHDTFEQIKMPKELSSDLICGRLTLKGAPTVYFISIYGNLEFDPFFTVFTGQIALIVTFLRTNFNAEHIVISGDFNCDRRMDDNPTKSTFARRGERVTNLFFDTILGLGFQNGMRKFHSEYLETYRHHIVKNRFPWELDHLFCTEKLYQCLSKLDVVDTEDVKALSDHNPIVAEFKIN
jgi:exonuclease III